MLNYFRRYKNISVFDDPRMTIVRLDRDNEILFPPYCIYCGESEPDSKRKIRYDPYDAGYKEFYRFQKNTSHDLKAKGIAPYPKRIWQLLLLFRAHLRKLDLKITVPCHEKCLLRAKNKLMKKIIICIPFALIILATIYFKERMSILFVYSLPFFLILLFIVNKYDKPNSMYYWYHGDKIIFSLLNPKFAQQFAELNNTKTLN